MFSQRAAKRDNAAPEVVRHSRYPSRLSVYADAPELEVSIEEFETFALDRLQVLRAIEDAQLRAKGDDDMLRRVNEALDKHLPLHTNRSRLPARQLMAERRKDHVSHFILRLAFSRTEELRGWFLRYECALLKHRFREADTAERQELLGAARLQLAHIPAAARDGVLGEASGFYSAQEPLFEVDFERVLDLVGRSQVVLRAGKAYVPQSEVAALLAHEFRQRLGRALAVCAKALPQLGEDERLVPVLHNLSSQTARREYRSATAAGAVSADSVDELADGFPLCMQHLHGQLVADRHLRHGGRMQLGLFLKGIGLDLQEALAYWRRAFGAMTDDQFTKGYAYNIRHNYGMEGRRVDYAPYSCHRIITTNPPGPGDHHGCPFRHFAADRLRTALHRDRLADADVGEIAGLAAARHFQVACTRHLEARLLRRPAGARPADAHPAAVTSPNQFFDMCTSAAGTAHLCPLQLSPFDTSRPSRLHPTRNMDGYRGGPPPNQQRPPPNQQRPPPNASGYGGNAGYGGGNAGYGGGNAGYGGGNSGYGGGNPGGNPGGPYGTCLLPLAQRGMGHTLPVITAPTDL
ncbi:DNA primase subunit pri2 [Coemansia biformis]|uniref:DNA primase subunit pri2 n=1 Tax=Coemansia biformis TaxID=1286918 RepID=A0A9W8CY50_9FUNG|nr:DNA primase subunit pri2 [Coemansia biformis]